MNPKKVYALAKDKQTDSSTIGDHILRSIGKDLRSALKLAEKELDLTAAMKIKEALIPYGEVAPATRDSKKYPTILEVEMNDKVPEMLVDLIIGHCNKVGQMVKGDAQKKQYTFGFKPEDANEVIEKIGPTVGVIINKANQKR